MAAARGAKAAPTYTLGRAHLKLTPGVHLLSRRNSLQQWRRRRQKTRTRLPFCALVRECTQLEQYSLAHKELLAGSRITAAPYVAARRYNNRRSHSPAAVRAKEFKFSRRRRTTGDVVQRLVDKMAGGRARARTCSARTCWPVASACPASEQTRRGARVHNLQSDDNVGGAYGLARQIVRLKSSRVHLDSNNNKARRGGAGAQRNHL